MNRRYFFQMLALLHRGNCFIAGDWVVEKGYARVPAEGSEPMFVQWRWARKTESSAAQEGSASPGPSPWQVRRSCASPRTPKFFPITCCSEEERQYCAAVIF